MSLLATPNFLALYSTKFLFVWFIWIYLTTNIKTDANLLRWSARKDPRYIKELETFRLINSRLQGHPTTHEGLPGVRIASGSLGQGLSVAIGACEAKKLNNEQVI